MSTHTLAEQISQFESKRQASAARMTDIMSKASDDGRTLDVAETEEYDGLAAEVKAVDDHLVRLKAHEVQMVAAATPISAAVGADAQAASAARAGVRPSGIISVKTNIEPGVRMARYALALRRSGGNLNDALSICQNNRQWMDQTPEISKVLMAAVAAGDTTTAGWASELVYAQNLANEFIEFLRPLTILGKLTNMRKIPFNVRMGSQTAGSTAYWVGQGAPVPVSKLTTSSASLGIAKCAGLVTIDDELAMSSSPSAELLVRDDLAGCISLFMDDAFINPEKAGAPNVAPDSVTFGLTPIDPSGTNATAVATDVKAVFASMIAANLNPSNCVWVMPATTAFALSLMLTSHDQPQYPTININGGTWFGLPVIVSQSAYIAGSPQYGNMIVLINPRELFLADDGQITISISNEASIQMVDNPTNTSTGGTTATTMVSMFQTNSQAIKAVRYVNWAKRRTTAVAFIQAAAYA